MSAALNASGRPMVFQCPGIGDYIGTGCPTSPNCSEMRGPYAYVAEACNSWRMFDDHHDNWVGRIHSTS